MVESMTTSEMALRVDELVDPDGGVNVERKHKELVNAGGSGSVDLDLTVSFPKDGWTQSLKKLPDVCFPSIYQHFMEKSLVVAARMSLASVHDDGDESSDTEIFSSFKGIDKGYNFFRSGHVQQIEMVEGETFSFVRCNVLPSMKKCTPYKTKVCLLPSGMVKVALCIHVQLGLLDVATMLLHYFMPLKSL